MHFQAVTPVHTTPGADIECHILGCWSKWGQVGSHDTVGSKWGQVGSHDTVGSKWGQVGSHDTVGSKWGQVGSHDTVGSKPESQYQFMHFNL